MQTNTPTNPTTPCAQGYTNPTSHPCAQGLEACAQAPQPPLEGATETIYYWQRPDKQMYWSRNSAEAKRTDDFNIFGCQSQTIEVPLDTDGDLIKELILQTITPCAQGLEACAQG